MARLEEKTHNGKVTIEPCRATLVECEASNSANTGLSKVVQNGYASDT